MRIGLVPGNAIEGVTYMDLKAIREEIDNALKDYTFAVVECINEDDSTVKVVFRAADVQIIMHQVWQKPQVGRIEVPQVAIPKPRIVQ